MATETQKKAIPVATVLAIAALLVSVGALGMVFLRPAGRVPTTQYLTILMGEGEIIQVVNGSEELTGEFHRWEPDVLVVGLGDTVVLTVKNPRSNIHSLRLDAFGVNTGDIDGKVAAPPSGSETTVTFVASQGGVFRFFCDTSFVEATGECDPDHARMVGYLVVLA